MEKKKIFVPKARTQNDKGGMPKALLGRVFVALSIGIVFVLVLALVWKQKAQPPIGDEGDAGKPKLYREIPKMTVPEPQVFSLDKVGNTTPKEPGLADTAAAPRGSSDAPGPVGPPAGSTTAGGPEPARTPGAEMKNTAPAGAPKISGTPSPSGAQPATAKVGPQPAAVPSTKTETPSTQLATATPKPSAAEPSGSWAYAVQVGAYSQKENAQQALERLKKLGFQPEITPFHHPKLGPLYAVRVSPFVSQAEAQKAAEKISTSEKDKPIIVKVPKPR